MSSRATALGAPLAAGAATAVALGAYGAIHDPTGRSFPVLGFSEVDTWKNGLATVVVVLFCAQVLIGMRVTGRFGQGPHPRRWLADVHRIIGTIAFGLSLPVAFHCLWALGYQSSSARVLTHSLLGCIAYGLYAAKVVAVRGGGSPPWVVPGVGSLLGAVMLSLWWGTALLHYTS